MSTVPNFLIIVQRLSQKIWYNISLCGEITKLGALIEDPCRIIFRLGTNSGTPPGGRHLEFQYGRHIAHTFVYSFINGTIRSVNVARCPGQHLTQMLLQLILANQHNTVYRCYANM